MAREAEYGWPRTHREGYPDLVGPEVGLNAMVEAFNAEHEHIQIVLVNQFGWSRRRIGQRLPAGMDFADFRRATDIEFGMATYEPFGISPLEPLGSGALCVISSVCGCRGFVDYVTDGRGIDNVIVGDFAQLDEARSMEELLALSHEQRDAVERRECAAVAETIMARLPLDDVARAAMLASGQRIVGDLGWDRVLEHKLIPMLQRVMAEEDNGA